jgi:hypothetical protein
VRLRVRGAHVLIGVGLAAACAAAACTAAAQSAAQPAFDELLQLFALRRHGRVSFTEVQQLAMLERPLQSSGELLYEAPDRLEKRTLRPMAETLILEHGVLTARRGHRTYVMELRDYPQVVPFIESIRATLAGDRAALERTFRVQFDGTLAHWTLLLVPADLTLTGTVKDIRIEGERDAIRTVEIRHADGDRSLLSIGPEVPVPP